VCRDATVCAVETVRWVAAVGWVGAVVRLAGLLLLADSRLPAGGHGHSGGVEALVDCGLLSSRGMRYPIEGDAHSRTNGRASTCARAVRLRLGNI